MSKKHGGVNPQTGLLKPSRGGFPRYLRVTEIVFLFKFPRKSRFRQRRTGVGRIRGFRAVMESNPKVASISLMSPFSSQLAGFPCVESQPEPNEPFWLSDCAVDD